MLKEIENQVPVRVIRHPKRMEDVEASIYRSLTARGRQLMKAWKVESPATYEQMRLEGSLESVMRHAQESLLRTLMTMSADLAWDHPPNGTGMLARMRQSNWIESVLDEQMPEILSKVIEAMIHRMSNGEDLGDGLS